MGLEIGSRRALEGGCGVEMDGWRRNCLRGRNYVDDKWDRWTESVRKSEIGGWGVGG